MTDHVTLAMGAGGKQTAELIENVFKNYLTNEFFTADDAAVLPQPKGQIAMSTDGFIVSPAFFPGGNAGELSVCGTVNDLTCMGAKPLYLTCSFVINSAFLSSSSRLKARSFSLVSLFPMDEALIALLRSSSILMT